MKTLLLSLCVLAPTLLASCTYTSTTYTPQYTGTYVASTTTTTTYSPSLDYVGYGFDSWYGGTPDYYNTTLYEGDW